MSTPTSKVDKRRKSMLYMQTFPIYKKQNAVANSSSQGLTMFKLFQQSVDENVICLKEKLNQRQLLLNSIRRFDKYLFRLQDAANEPITFAGCSPRNNDSDGSTKSTVLCSFLQDTNQGRGLKIVKETIRDAPGSSDAQLAGISVILNTLIALDDVEAAQKLAAEVRVVPFQHDDVGRNRRMTMSVNGEGSILDETLGALSAARTQDEGRTRRMTMIAHWKRISSPAATLASQHQTRSTMVGVLENLATLERRCSTRHRDRSLRKVQSLRETLPEASESNSTEDEIRQARWLPHVASNSEGLLATETVLSDGTPRSGARATKWVEKMIDMDLLQLCLVAMHNVKAPSMQLLCLETVRIFTKLDPCGASAQILSPLRKSLFFSTRQQDPYQTAPSAREFAVRQKISSPPTGMSLLLHTMDIHNSRFDVQGVVASVIVTLLEAGNPNTIEKIGDSEAFEPPPQHGHVNLTTRSLKCRPSTATTKKVETRSTGNDDTKTAAKILVRVLRRWNFGPEFWVRREHSTGCLFTPEEQFVCANSHRNVTLALVMLLNRDERSRASIRDDTTAPRAGAALMSAGSVHSSHDKVIEAEMDRYYFYHGSGISADAHSSLSTSSGLMRTSSGPSRPCTRA